MKTSTITMIPMHDFKPGDYVRGMIKWYVVMEVPNGTTVTVHRLYWWERLRIWVTETWFDIWLELRWQWTRLRRRLDSGRTPK